MAERIFVSGHRGMVGSAVCRRLAAVGGYTTITAGREQLDLSNQQAVFDFFAQERPQSQVICAAVVGGIVANDTYPADFIGHNLMIQTNLLEAARRFSCQRTIFMASACIYPRITEQPMQVEQLLTGALEPTNEWYAVAKLAGIKMGQAYRRQLGLDIVSVLPANLYGPHDSFDLENSHVVPGLMRRFYEAKLQGTQSVAVWGSGRGRREFLHVDDTADATIFLLNKMRGNSGVSGDANAVPEVINIGYGEDITIADLAQKIKAVVGYEGELVFDTSRPDGTPRKLLDSAPLMTMGWSPRITLQDGLASTYQWLVNNVANLREIKPDAWRAGAAR